MPMPRFALQHGAEWELGASPMRMPEPPPSSRHWHAGQDAPAALSRLLLRGDYPAADRTIDRALEDGASLEALYREIFEPAARHLGALWSDDRCSDLDVALGLSHLQVEVRQLRGVSIPCGSGRRGGRSVLLAPPPGETHMLGAAMASELFWRDGWCVHCEFPATTRALRRLVHEHWFDVLALSMSSALRREERLQDLAQNIREAYAASLNPNLTVVVDGRLFFERPQAYRQVGADAACVSSAYIVAVAERLLDARAAH